MLSAPFGAFLRVWRSRLYGPGDGRGLVRRARRARARRSQRLRARGASLAYHPMSQLDGHLPEKRSCSDAFVCQGRGGGVFDAVNCQHSVLQEEATDQSKGAIAAGS